MFTDADHSMGLRGAYWELMAWLESFVSPCYDPFYLCELLGKKKKKIALSRVVHQLCVYDVSSADMI